ncbi:MULTISPECIES: hypothetical protein [Campylobacter]|uniref:hypothetical protein n=1 Tax=Campylobacter TaxID=194 RepID=UPI000A33BA06|nr:MULTISPECIES: hypothetical protein [unclassified Campylobacter]MCR8678809.1 hypothetical protein [Campylobacter sp. RM19072]MCR8696857.1 hypothetical protein [Campylobacter sp. RM19073]MEE3776646.1 hypothetical protein [Campylobacter sp. CX2-4080-23]
MDREKYIELYSKARIDSYNSIYEHEANFEMIDKIASKLARIEIIIRNKINRKMCELNKNWMFNLPNHIKLDNESKIQDRDILVSRQTFGFWIRVVEHYKIHSCAFDKEFLDSFSFKKYYDKNKERLNKTPLNNYQKAYGILLLIKSIRNRAFHFENLLKIRVSGAPRLSVRVDFSKEKFFYFSIKPDMITQYLDDILQSFIKI